MTKSNSRKSKSGNKKPQKTTAKTTALIPQAHGGALRPGGTLGNRGGGRPPDVVRERARDAFYTQIPTLEKIAEGKLKHRNVTPNFDQRMKAIDQLGKYGLPPETKIVAAQADTPEGYTFTLVLGERGQP